jgi:hypothetical protein
VGNLVFLVPMLAGFGLEALLDRFAQPQGHPDRLIAWGKWAVPIAVLAESVVYTIAFRDMIRFFQTKYPELFAVYPALEPMFKEFLLICATTLRIGTAGFAVYGAIVLSILVLVLGFKAEAALARRFRAALIIYCVGHAVAYQALYFGKFSVELHFLRPVLPALARVHKYDFEVRRTNSPTSPRADLRTEFGLSPHYVQYPILHSFLQWDPCITPVKIQLLNKHVAALFRFRNWAVDYSSHRAISSDPEDVLGCRTAKLRLIAPENPPELGSITVTAFSANRLEAACTVTHPGGAWLYYADAWHPGWKAFVDGTEAPIARAYGAFKSVKLEPGEHQVRFVFDQPSMRMANDALMVLGGGFMVVMCGAVGACLRREFGGINWRTHRRGRQPQQGQTTAKAVPGRGKTLRSRKGRV